MRTNVYCAGRRSAPWAALGAALVMLLTALPAATAADSDSAPIEVMVQPLPLGYNWSEWSNATHVQINVASGSATIDVTNVKTTWLNVETAGLKPGHNYTLSGPVDTPSSGPATPSGTEVFWNVPNFAGVYTLTDTTTGTQAATIYEAASAPDPLSPQPMGTAKASCYGYGCPGSSPKPPQPDWSYSGSGRTTNQFAYSFTSEIKITSKNCWGHVVTVEPYVTAGSAAASGTAGGKFTYDRKECTTINSQGTPTRLSYYDTFREDHYPDNSYKIYLAEEGSNILIQGYNAYFNPDASARTITVQNTRDTAAVDVTEKGTAGVYFKGSEGAEFAGYSFGVTLSNDNTLTSEVTMEILPPDLGTHNYKVRFASGDSFSTGLIGEAWKVN